MTMYRAMRMGLLLLALIASGAEAQRRPAYSPLVTPGQPQQEAAAQILEQLSELSPDGSFRTSWSSSNGISFEEVGQPKSLGQGEVAEEVQGSASWTSSDGQPISLRWRADENGAQIEGEHLPTAPPVPPLIQRALDYIAANPPRSAQEGAYVADAANQGFNQGFPTSTRRPTRPF